MLWLMNPPFLKGRLEETDGPDNSKLMRWGRSTISFRATFLLKGAKTYDADIINLDEVDEHNQGNLEFTEDRIMHSPLGWRVAGSQPSSEDLELMRIQIIRPAISSVPLWLRSLE